jgi:hypothetical protein
MRAALQQNILAKLAGAGPDRVSGKEGLDKASQRGLAIAGQGSRAAAQTPVKSAAAVSAWRENTTR